MWKAIVFFLLFVGLGWIYISQQSPLPTSVFLKKISPTPSLSYVIPSSILFVPYWAIGNTDFPKQFDGIAYFGIAPSDTGIDTTEDGYKNLSLFTQKANGPTLLVIRITQQDIAKKIVEDTKLQNKIIEQSIGIAKQNHFSGIILDLEYQALAFDSVTQPITQFIRDFVTESHQQHLSFITLMYGDTYYRARPFDVKAIAKISDGIMVMAYDFHKAKGNPGPNFPLQHSTDEDYDLQLMTQDFFKDVPKEKLSIVFGFFGYDWQVSDKGQAIATGVPMSLQEITQKFFPQCPFSTCEITRDIASKETKITYTDDKNALHEVWYEDMDSMQKKKAFLQTQGITKTAIWAYSYF